MTHKPVETRVPDWLVEKVHLGLATEEELRLVHGDPDAMARLSVLPTEDAIFRARYPIEEEVRRIESKLRVTRAADERSNRARMLSAVLAPSLAVAAALMMATLPNGQPSSPESPDGVTIVKGLSPKLRLYRKRDGSLERIGTGALAREGDVLQLGMVPGSARHGVVLSIDGRGTVTLHHPADARADTALGSGEQPLPNGYELDDAPEFERFFFVTSEGPADVSTVLRAASALAASGQSKDGTLSLPESYQQTSLTVRKEAK